jgi:uncharacterized protein YceK
MLLYFVCFVYFVVNKSLLLRLQRIRYNEEPMKRIVVLVCLSILCLTGCATFRGQTARKAPKMIYSGFSVERPQDRRWTVNTNEQTGFYALFRLDPPSPTHSFSVSVTLSVLGGTPADPGNLEELVKNLFSADDTNRFAILDFAVNITTNQGRIGATYTEQLLDRNPADPSAPLLLIRHGYVTPHPDNPNVILQAMYTEQGREDEVNQAEYTSLGKAFLKGVRFEKLRY